MHNAAPLSTINIIRYSMVRVGYGGKQNLFGDRGRFVNAIIGRTLGRSRQPSASISSDRPRLSHSLRYPNTAQNSDKLSAVEKSATTDPWDQSEILDNKMHRSLRSGRHSVADSSSLIIALILWRASRPNHVVFRYSGLGRYYPTPSTCTMPPLQNPWRTDMGETL